jgi:hypothetical protein
MNAATPVIFADGMSFYAELAKTYIRHTNGLFILAPSGAGKTHFVNKQTDMHWIDGDYLWPAANADLSDDSWSDDREMVEEINIKSDVITHQAKKLGFWIIGSSNSFLKPDAIVLPDWETHAKYIRNRESTDYDGGAKTEDYGGVLAHRDIIARWEKQGVPCFSSIEKAAAELRPTGGTTV